jgi:two-component system invasion response regulator UvrY
LPVLILSMHAEPLYITLAMEAGARGYVHKNIAPDELIAAIRQVAAGGRYTEGELAQALVLSPTAVAEPFEQLSSRDLEVMRLLARGRSLSEIADALGLGYKTIANTCTQIKSKLEVSRTADLVRLAVKAVSADTLGPRAVPVALVRIFKREHDLVCMSFGSLAQHDRQTAGNRLF